MKLLIVVVVGMLGLLTTGCIVVTPVGSFDCVWDPTTHTTACQALVRSSLP